MATAGQRAAGKGEEAVITPGGNRHANKIKWVAFCLLVAVIPYVVNMGVNASCGGDQFASHIHSGCGACWAVSISYASQGSAFPGMVAQYACEKWTLMGFSDGRPTCWPTCPVECDCYNGWGISPARVKTVMDRMGFSTVPNNGPILAEVMEQTFCNSSSTYYLAFYIDHAVAISGIVKNPDSIYYCYRNDMNNEFMWEKYSVIALQWTAGTIRSDGFFPSSDWRNYVSVDDIDTFAVSQFSSSRVKVDFGIVPWASENDRAAVYISDNSLGPARLVEWGYPELEPAMNTWFDTLLQFTDNYYYFLDHGGSISGVCSIDELRKPDYPVYPSMLHFAASVARPVLPAPSSLIARDNPMDMGQAIILEWVKSTADSIIDCYNIYRAENSVQTLRYLTSVAAGSSSYLDSCVAPGVQYWYRISAAHHGNISGDLSGSYGIWNDFNPVVQGPIEPIDNLSNTISFVLGGYDSLFACPQGDSDTLRVSVQVVGDDSVYAQGLPGNEMWLVPFDYPQVHMCTDRVACVTDADSLGIAEFAYPYMGGCGTICLAADIKGRASNNILTAYCRSADLNGSGIVNVSDLPIFGGSYRKSIGDSGYSSCCDFSWDNKCNLTDFALFGTHYQHGCPSLPLPVFSSKARAGKVKLVQSDENSDDMLEVSLVLDGIDRVCELSIMVNNELTDMEYIGFDPNSELGKTVLAVPVRNGSRDIVFIAAFGGDAPSGSTIELGSLRYKKTTNVAARAQASADISADGVYVIYGEALDSDHQIWIIDGSSVGEDGKEVPRVDYLAANYPNPFNPGTHIEYGVNEDSWVRIDVYDIGGRIVKTLVNEAKERGLFIVYWDGRNDKQMPVASGVYFCRMQTGKHEIVRKLVLMR